MRPTTAAAALCVASGTAFASVTPIAPFTGEATETFEQIGPPGPTPGPAEIFGGEALAYDTAANFLMIATSLHSFLTNTTIFPYNGNMMGGSVTGWMTFEFDTPVTDFGGYFGTADILEGSHIVFRDAAGDVIGDEPMPLELGEWGWYGWHSTEGIAKVEVFGAAEPNLPVVFDDLRVNYIPTPGVAGVLAMGGAVALRRRRR